MAASHETVRLVCKVVRKHVTPETFRVIVTDLLQVPGNKSFKDTIRRMADEIGEK